MVRGNGNGWVLKAGLHQVTVIVKLLAVLTSSVETPNDTPNRIVPAAIAFKTFAGRYSRVATVHTIFYADITGKLYNTH